MDTTLHDYTKDPARAYWLFAADWSFSVDVWDYMRTRLDRDTWYLASAQRLTESAYRVTFLTNEYLNPDMPDASLRLNVIQVGTYPNLEYQVSPL